MEVRNYVNGKFIDSISKKNVAVINPANQNTVGFIDEALDDELELAYLAASNSFKKRVLQDMDPVAKSQMMRAIANKLRDYKNIGAKILSQENG